MNRRDSLGFGVEGDRDLLVIKAKFVLLNLLEQ